MNEWNPKIVCITGMERSGSSMITRILNFLGVYLGPKENLILETDYNIKGCWEHKFMLNISEKILQRFDGNTHNPPDFPSEWVDDPRISDLKAQAKQIIQDDFGNKNLWGWKDTRCCLTLPFWQNLLPEIVYIICLRNPLDVAKSLVGKKWASSIIKSSNLWLSYNASVIKYTHSKDRIFVFYDDFFKNWRSEVKRLASFLGPIPKWKISEVEPDIEVFIEKELQHYETSLIDTINSPEIPFPIKALYLTLIQFAKNESYNSFKETIDATPSQLIDYLGYFANEDMSIIRNLLINIDKKEKQLAERGLQIADKDQQLIEKDKRIQALLKTYSWRITSPLRKAYNLLIKAK